jgi:aarF domain-containing kinase
MLTVLRAWAREAEAELDFCNEAAHLRAVGANLRAAGVRVLVPQPLHGLVGSRAFVMEFVPGFKLTDRALLALHGVDRDALMARVTAAYACQLFTDGKFNADPHPGNLLVSLDAARAAGGGGGGGGSGGGGDASSEACVALLDFGWTVELPTPRRLAYCALVAATAEMDAGAIADAMRALGLASNQPDKPERDLAFWAHYLRDTGGRTEQRAEMDTFLETRKAERRADRAAGGETRRIVHVPDDFLFFLRTLGLLRGLATLLDAKVPYLELLCMYAKRALLRDQLGLPSTGGQTPPR